MPGRLDVKEARPRQLSDQQHRVTIHASRLATASLKGTSLRPRDWTRTSSRPSRIVSDELPYHRHTGSKVMALMMLAALTVALLQDIEARREIIPFHYRVTPFIIAQNTQYNIYSLVALCTAHVCSKSDDLGLTRKSRPGKLVAYGCGNVGGSVSKAQDSVLNKKSKKPDTVT